jgi:hypothetical protein
MHAELMMEAEVLLAGGSASESVRLPDSIRRYARHAWQDRLYLDVNASQLQQEVSCQTHGCTRGRAGMLTGRWTCQ